MRRVVIAAAVAAGVGACATLTKGTTQTIGINTPGAPGAMCTLSSSDLGSQVVQTPAILTVGKSQDSIAVRCQKECFQDGATIIASGTEGMTAGNIIAGGVIGLGIDAASGAMNKYAAQTDVVMVPIQGCGRTAPMTRRR
jgi:hypothetical protein